MKDVIGFGSLNLDLIYEVNSLEVLKEVGLNIKPGSEIFAAPEYFQPLIDLLEKNGRLRQKDAGGSAANTLFALACMGFKVGMCGKIGQDAAGAFLISEMGGVDLTAICFGAHTGVALICLEPGGERSIIVFPYANSTLSYEELNRSYLRETRFLHLSSFVSDATLTVQKKIVEELSPRVKISFDPGEIYARKGLASIKSILERTFVLFCTEQEIEIFTGAGTYQRGARQLLAYGPEVVVCKRGASGSYLCNREAEFNVPALTVKAVDTTGAGDVHNAGFLAGILHNLSWEDCTRLATAAAAQSVTGYGRNQYPDREFLRQRLVENKPRD